MNAIPPDLVEEADVQAPAKRRHPRLARAALIAACLCLALVGTTAAAVIERMSIQISNSAEDHEYTFFGSRMARYSLSEFSPALNAASENRDSAVVSLTFPTWDEVKAFLGEDIPCVWPPDWNGQFQVMLFHVESETLWGIDIDSVDLERQAEIYMEIRTEHWQNEYAQIGMSAPDGEFGSLPDYAMANGETAYLLQYTGPEEFPLNKAIACFMQDGILYQCTIFSPVPPQNNTVSQLHALLDSFPAG